MERRDDDGDPAGQPGGSPSSRCVDPAGASPVSVSASAPSSRPAAEGEIPTAEAGCRKRASRREPISEERVREPQHEVKPAASKQSQPGGRADHLAGKATSATRALEHVVDPGGVGGAARVQGSIRNTRDPSAPPSSRLGGSNRPRAKAPIAQRKSDGAIVPMRTAPHNAVGGKGHERGHVVEEGKREGMAARPNHPERRRAIDKVRQLQRRLCAAAKQSPERRFHALYDRIWRSDVLQEAWRRVRRNRGAAGLDRQTLADVEQLGVERFLEEVGAELRAGTYRRLRGTIRYPEATQYRWHESPPTSRVREIREHGFDGGRMETRATREGK